jgi:hypothetical protein
MVKDAFDYEIDDAQGTAVGPVEPRDFDIDRYADYEAALLERNSAFWKAESGVAVYRRFRVPRVFSYGCRDTKASLALQLGGLAESMKFKADIANFLEPWYGIGTVASAFGVDYDWPPGQAPAVRPPFKTVREALGHVPVPVTKTPIGRHTLDMIERFIDATKGRVPVSPADTQSPMDTASFLVENNSFFMSFFEDPAGLEKLLDIITGLLIDFTRKQLELIGEAAVWPGHGFASSRRFSGLGASDDVSMMLSGEQYLRFEAPCLSRLAEAFGGVAFHSCGNWSGQAEAVAQTPGLVMVDGAFSAETDPDPNPAGPFAAVFAGTGTAVNARMVGSAETVVEKAKALCRPGMKVVATTYCKTPAEQERVYDEIHALVEK